jgi:hypothetical protein
MLDLERRLARRVEVAVVAQRVVFAHDDLKFVNISSKTIRILNPYRLTASRQLHSRILLLVVLPERRLEGLQQARIVSSQSLDICNIAQQPKVMRAIGDNTHQPRRSKAAYVSSRLN